MYTQVAYALAVASTADAVSQAVALNGANAVGVDLTVINADGGSLEVDLEGSNDLSNWAQVAGDIFTDPITAAGYNEVTVPATVGERIPFAYVRLKYTQSTATKNMILSAGINVFEA